MLFCINLNAWKNFHFLLTASTNLMLFHRIVSNELVFCKVSKLSACGVELLLSSWFASNMTPPPANRSKLEIELGFDIDSIFGETVAMFGVKRTSRAIMKYISTELTGEEDPASKVGVVELDMATLVPNMDQDQPNPAPVQPSNTVRARMGSVQTPKRGGKGRKDSLVLRRFEPLKEDPMDIDTVVNNDTTSENITVEVKDSPESPSAAEDRAEVVSTAGDKFIPVTAEDNIPGSEESSPGKTRHSKDNIAAFLTSAGVVRVEDTHDIVEGSASDSNLVDISIIAGTDSIDDKDAGVAMLDAKISAADEELHPVLRNLNRKRSCSGDSKFHSWAAHTTVVPRTGFSIRFNTVGADHAQLDTAWASFGMTNIDLLMSSDYEEGLLEVVMSQPVQRGIKKMGGSKISKLKKYLQV
jgi:hypothetical protein